MKELMLRQAVQGPVRRRQTFSLMLSISLVHQHILPENWPFSRSRTNDYTVNVLLMEMLFLGSMVMIIIVTNLAWEPISQDLYPCLHSNSISCIETLSGNCCPWLILYQSYLRMYVLGKGLIDLLQRWGILFICSQQLVEKYRRSHLN